MGVLRLGQFGLFFGHFVGHFPIYYAALFAEKNTIYFAGYEVKNTAMISFVTGCAFLVVAFISPLLSGIADFVGNKKTFMKFLW